MTVVAEAGTRQRIVAAAVALFAEQGFDATSVNQVVARAGVAKGALYHHFESKDDLLYEVYRELVDRQLAGLNAILARRLSPTGTLRALIADMVETTAASAAEAKVFAREGHRLGDANQARVRAARRAIHDAFSALVRTGQASGEFGLAASPEMVTFTVFGVINELPVWYRPDGPKRPAQLAGELTELILAGLRPVEDYRPAAAPPGREAPSGREAPGKYSGKASR
ncbi:MAG: TetR/AcrR family transcriptional regulator [Actinomycetota bacterium]|nr:TetR/AcrR family transcriptional regulator [Actinomycetota bacterium]MDQ2959035.1 TetR/AcrR family transcriptional regulator [Actinomycetota bacterium]